MASLTTYLPRIGSCPVLTALNHKLCFRALSRRHQFLGQVHVESSHQFNNLLIRQYRSSSQLYSKRNLIQSVKANTEVAAVLENDEKKKIQVFGIGDDLMMVTTRNKAKEQASKEGLKLVELDPSAKPYPTYKFMSGKELHEFQMQQKETKKQGRKMEKLFRISTKTSSHDLEVKLKQMKEWIHKGMNINLSIKASHNASDEEAASENSKVLKTITDHVIDIAVVKLASQAGKDMHVILRPKPGADQQDKGSTQKVHSSKPH